MDRAHSLRNANCAYVRFIASVIRVVLRVVKHSLQQRDKKSSFLPL